MRKQKLHIGALLIIPFFLLMEFTLTSYKHYHVLPSGEIICHSHPYKNDNNTHKHTHKELYTIGIFNPLVYSNTPNIILVKFKLPLTGILTEKTFQNITAKNSKLLPSRAPPKV